MLAEEEIRERQTEWVLVPIAFWSRALSGAQLNWTVWEQELYSVRESTYSWRAWITGTHCQIYPDCLNNLVVTNGETLRQPGKIMRWTEDILTRVRGV